MVKFWKQLGNSLCQHLGHTAAKCYCTAMANFYARVKRSQLENSLSYCVNACVLRRSERALRSEMNVSSKGQQSAGRLKIYLNENNLAFCYYKSDTVPVH